MRRRAFLASAVAVATVLLTGPPAGAGTLQPAGWQLARTAPANLVGGGDALSCITPSWCMSVGSGGTQVWDGTEWRSASTGKFAFTITDLSCYSRWDCMVVGYVTADTSPGASYRQPVALHWNGSGWDSLYPTVQLPSEYAFSGVSCPASRTCFITGPLDDRVLLWQNGTWTSQPISMPAGADNVALGSIDCPAVTACHAIASVHLSSQPSYAVSTAMASWDGSSWTTQLVPDDVRGPVGLGSISCPTTTWCMAVGSDAEAMIGDVWNGTSWQASPIPDSPHKGDNAEQTIDGFEAMTGVSCWAVDRCQAVGLTNTAPFHRLWTGTTWSSLANPSLAEALAATGGGYELHDIDCVYASFCLDAGGQMEQYNP